MKSIEDKYPAMQPVFIPSHIINTLLLSPDRYLPTSIHIGGCLIIKRAGPAHNADRLFYFEKATFDEFAKNYIFSQRRQERQENNT